MRWIPGAACTLAGLLIFATGCGGPQVQRIPEDAVVDLSGRWNDTDSQLVSEEMIQDCMNHPWVTQQQERARRNPIVIVGIVRNESEEHIAIKTFIGDIEKALINSGRVEMVASAEERQQVRDERDDQQRNASEETMKRWGQEHGADYLMGGAISSITDTAKGETVIFYQVDLNLVNIETNQKVWQGQKKIKKYIGRKKLSY